jgi:hypothetical protein
VLTLENETLRLDVSADGYVVLLTDRLRRCRWRLDRELTGYCPGERDEELTSLPPGKAKRRSEAIAVTHVLDEGPITFLWRLRDAYAEVRLETEATGIDRILLPGALRPDDGPGDVAAPVYQGLLIRPSGKTWRRWVGHGGHIGFTMSLLSVIAERGALLVAHDSYANWWAMLGEDARGPFASFAQWRCPVDGWRYAALRLYPVGSNLTAICKRYRARMVERGDLVTWAEKIERKPIVQNLFGCLFAFLGYNKTSEINYVGSARTLKSYGFDSIFFYSARMCHHSLDFKMGGDDPIWLSDEEIAGIKAIEGAHVAPWGWTIEGLDDGSEAMRRIFRIGPDGKPVPGWRLDEYRWHLVCTPYQIEHIKRRFATDMAQMDWIHYDVCGCIPGRPCFSTTHAAHGNRPMGRMDDLEWTRKLFGVETVGNRVVSSEGFADSYAGHYDIGSTKIMPLWGSTGRFVPVPMTMLVFHDCCIQNWWELDTYNATPAGGGAPQDPILQSMEIAAGSGRADLKAAMDALYGLPPNLFPFGKQYFWADFKTLRTFSFLVKLEEAEVQKAIAAALPVARLHKRIGACEMTSFEMLSPDGLVQSTKFSDGTRVVANLSDSGQEVEGYGRIAGHRWVEGARSGESPVNPRH